jgi:uncharacterized cofD-like protein
VKRPHIVCIGGGTGQAQVLRGLARYPVRLASIVNVTDNGGHSGFLRQELGVPPMGDIRNCLAALGQEGVVNDLMRARFRKGKLDGTSVGNLMLAAMTTQTGSLSRAVGAMAEALGIREHRVMPVSDGPTDIGAELDNGKIVRGEWQILLRKPRRPIVRLFLDPPIDALPECTRAIREADLIVLCPGALMAAVISCLLARGVRQAIQQSRGRLAHVCNIMTMPGQTDEFDATDHLEWVARYSGRRPDYFLLNTNTPDESASRPYRKLGSRPVRDDLSGTNHVKVVRGDFLWESSLGDDRGGKGIYLSLPHTIRHDHQKLSKALLRLARS